MSIFLHFLLLTLTLVSIEARKLNSNAIVFEVDLIHRDFSLHSPYYDPSISHLARQRRLLSRGRNLQQVNASAEEEGAEVIPNHGEYLMKLSIGTPPVEFTGILDTGSDLVWLQCAPCNDCLLQQTPLFDASKSSTYKTLPCSSNTCTNSYLVSGCSVNDTGRSGPCLYEESYGDGTSTSGALSTDTVTIPSMAFLGTVFGCGFKQHAASSLTGEGLGVVGLGGGPLSLISQLGPKVNHKFSYCLAPLNRIGLGPKSKLRFGADITSPETTPLIITDYDPTFYYLKLDRISIGNNKSSSPIPVGQNIMIDSGSTLTTLDPFTYHRVKDQVVQAMGLTPVPDPDHMVDLCFKTTEFAASPGPPDVVFRFDGANVALKRQNTFFDLGNVTCFMVMPKRAGDTMTFGNFAQVNFEVGYDLGAQQVTFAPRDCANL